MNNNNKDTSLEVKEDKLLSTSNCSKCECNPKLVPEFELKDSKLVSKQIFQSAFSFEFYARIILKYKNDPSTQTLSVEKTAEPQILKGGGQLFIGRRDDKQKGGKGYLWDRSNDRNDCKKLYISGGFVSLNSCRLKPANVTEFGDLRRDRYCFHSTDGSTELVVVHVTPREAKRCRCYCHKDIPFETRKRKSAKKSEDQPASKKPLVAQATPETTSDAIQQDLTHIASILVDLKASQNAEHVQS